MYRLLDALGDHGKQGAGLGTDKLFGLLAVLEEHERRHGADAKFLAQFW
jgi:hypothetical protein